MAPFLIKEYITYKDFIEAKGELLSFAATFDQKLYISENENEVCISNKSISIYITSASNQGGDVLSIPLKPYTCHKIIFLFHNQLAFDKGLIRFQSITDFLISFSDDEIKEINKSMPLINSIALELKTDQLTDFAIIWRDHFLEENIPLLKSFERIGVSAEWIFPIEKGDQTIKRDRIAAYFRRSGYYHVGTLQNLLTPTDEREDIQLTLLKIDEFVALARNRGKKVMVIDDGGIIADYYCENQKKFECAIEVTVVGIRKLKKLKSIDIPIYDLGLSELKETITYPEIAESCVKRIRELIPAEKILGRRVMILGYGTAGKHIASIFRNIGANVSVVDHDILKLISAAEKGFMTYRTAISAIKDFTPFLIVCCTGEVSLKYEDYLAVSNGTYITGIATKDLEEIRNSENTFVSHYIPNTGFVHQLVPDKYFIQLGDGRSVNLYRSEAIPNRANDIFKTAILFAAKELSDSYKCLIGEIYTNRVNDFLKASSIYERYYRMYFQRNE